MAFGNLTFTNLIPYLLGKVSSLSREKVNNTYPVSDAGKVLGIGSDGKVVPQEGGGGGGEPSKYIKDASASGDTLTLTKKDGSTVSFAKRELDEFFTDGDKAAPAASTGNAIGANYFFEPQDDTTHYINSEKAGNYFPVYDAGLTGDHTFIVLPGTEVVYSGAAHISFKAGANCQVTFVASDPSVSGILWANDDEPTYEDGKIYDIVLSPGVGQYIYASYAVYTEPTV